MGKQHWSDRRQKDLQAALAISLENPELGEQHPEVKRIKQHVNVMDHVVASKSAAICLGHGVTMDPKTGTEIPVGDYVKHNYLCRKWSGAQGASVARGGEGPELLPQEIEQVLEDRAPKATPITPALVTKKDGE